MLVSITPGLTLNIGESTAISANQIHYDVDTAEPVNPQIGDFRFVPSQIVANPNSKLQLYDPDEKKWLDNIPTVFDVYLANSLVENEKINSDNMVYYKLMHEVTSDKVIDDVTAIETIDDEEE